MIDSNNFLFNQSEPYQDHFHLHLNQQQNESPDWNSSFYNVDDEMPNSPYLNEDHNSSTFNNEENGSIMNNFFNQMTETTNQEQTSSINTNTNYIQKSNGEGSTVESQKHTNTNKSTISGKTRKIKKDKYEPIYEDSKVYKYEDNPELYKAIRKKIQNRESARRVRERKVVNHSDVTERVKYLEIQNHELTVKNATLSAENDLLRDQIKFMEKLL